MESISSPRVPDECVTLGDSLTTSFPQDSLIRVQLYSGCAVRVFLSALLNPKGVDGRSGALESFAVGLTVRNSNTGIESRAASPEASLGCW